jgi:hypothetical protein
MRQGGSSNGEEYTLMPSHSNYASVRRRKGHANKPNRQFSSKKQCER